MRPEIMDPTRIGQSVLATTMVASAAYLGVYPVLLLLPLAAFIVQQDPVRDHQPDPAPEGRTALKEERSTFLTTATLRARGHCGPLCASLVSRRPSSRHSTTGPSRPKAATSL